MNQVHVLYITRNGLLEPLGRSQILSYVLGLARSCSFTVISFEKPADLVDPLARNLIQAEFQLRGVLWIQLLFRSKPRPYAASFSALQLTFVAICQWCRRQKPDLVHARSYVPAAIALLIRRLTGVPFIFDMRALWPEELITAGHLCRGSLLHRALLWIERRCIKEASAVVSLTSAAVDYLQYAYPSELAKQRVAVIPTCVDLKRFQFAPLSTTEPLVIGCIGTLLSGWFLLDWLRAFFEAVARVNRLARFELISRDSEGLILYKLNLPPNLRNRLQIKAALPEEMPSIVQRQTVSVMFYAGGATSELGRSPTRMAEALGCGRPVVANSGVGDVAEVIRRHRVGVLAPGCSPTEMDSCVAEMLDLLKDPELSYRSRQTAEQLFSLEAGTAAYRRLYEDILT